ncbi:MAG TPA: hypothetical protein VNP96_10860 [Solirubrobacterales bacterium]|nr:hypothetical protein [Solirubrobacterales bacterium]
MDQTSRPPLSVAIPARDGLAEVVPVLEALIPAAEETGTEIVVVGGTDTESPAGCVRVIPTPVADMVALRRQAMAEATGAVVAVGEDHAVPRPGWCEAVIRAHADHPEAAAIAGCLVNATDQTLSGRANFLAFAAAWQPPMATLPGGRPPPSSALSFKREALAGIGSKALGWLEAELIPTLFERGLMVADERVVVDHYQDHGGAWSIRNAYDSARSSYGYLQSRLDPAERRKLALWTLSRIPPRLHKEAREAARGTRTGVGEAALIGLIVTAAGAGAAAGAMLGPGRSPERVA